MDKARGASFLRLQGSMYIAPEKQDWKFQSISASQYAFWITYYLNFSVKKWSKGPKKFKIIKLIKMVKMIKNDQFGQKIEKKLEKKK